MSQSVKNSRFTTLLNGCNCIYLRKKLIEVGMYDTSNRTNGEDVLISNKLISNKYFLWQESSAVCFHLRKDDVFSVIRTRWGWANAKKNIKCPEVYSLFSLFFKTLAGIGWSLKCLKNDLKQKNFDLIYIDLFMPFYWFFYTTKKYIQYKGEELKSIKNSINNF